MDFITQSTRDLVEIIFPEKMTDSVISRLDGYCRWLHSSANWKNAEGYERLCFAILKLAKGSEAKLDIALKLARADYRDLLVAAKFANSTTIHKDWHNRLLRKAKKKGN
jgi:hypothetical protein